VIRNLNTSFRLMLESVGPLRETTCAGTTCMTTLHAMEWEGRPPDSSVISPTGAVRWELKGGLPGLWAAQLRYAIERTPHGVFDVTMMTNGLDVKSTCTIHNTNAARCNAVGVRAEFKDPPRPRAEVTARLGVTQSVSGRYEVAACPDLEMQIGKRVAAPRRTCGIRRPSSTPGTAVARRRRPRSRQNPGSKAQKTIGSTSLWGLWDQPPLRYFSSATMSSLA
jgi:hypothetical protein